MYSFSKCSPYIHNRLKCSAIYLKKHDHFWNEMFTDEFYWIKDIIYVEQFQKPRLLMYKHVLFFWALHTCACWKSAFWCFWKRDIASYMQGDMGSPGLRIFHRWWTQYTIVPSSLSSSNVDHGNLINLQPYGAHAAHKVPREAQLGCSFSSKGNFSSCPCSIGKKLMNDVELIENISRKQTNDE